MFDENIFEASTYHQLSVKSFEPWKDELTGDKMTTSPEGIKTENPFPIKRTNLEYR